MFSKGMTWLVAVAFVFVVACSGQNDSDDQVTDLPSAPVATRPVAANPAVASASIVPPGANLIKNTSLESDASGWKTMFQESAEGCRSADPNAVHSGKYGLLVKGSAFEWDGVHYGTRDINHDDATTLPAQPNTNYVVSAWIKGIADDDGVQVWLSPVVSSNTATDEQFMGPKVVLTPQWQRVEYAFTTKSGARFMGIRVIKVNNKRKASFAVDDVTLIRK